MPRSGERIDEPVEAPAERPTIPSGADRFRAALEVLFCSGFPSQLAIAYLMAAAGYQPYLADGRLSSTYVFTLSLADAVVVLGLVFLFLRLDGEAPKATFLGRRPAGPEVRLGILLVPVLFLVVAGMLGVLHRVGPWLHNVTSNPLEALLESPRDAWVFGVVAIVSGGVREEVQRAFVLRRFERYLGGASVGLALFSVAFAAGHLVQGRDVAVTTGILGVLWGLLYLVRGSVVAPVVSHAGFNVAELFRYTAYGA
jgi:membrane protease YdiL (CAAX protease family)